MSSTATLPAVVTPVHSVTVNGAQITSEMSPLERHNIVARSMGLPTAPRPAGITFGPQGHTQATAASGTIAGKPAPPSPQELEASRSAKVAEFDAEMRAAGKQITPQSRDASGRFASVPPDQVDAAGIKALTNAYVALTPAERDGKRAQYTAELAEFFQGRQLGETRAAFLARRNGESAPAPTQQQHTPQQWRDGHKSVTDKDGWIPLERVNAAGLSGYTLPKLVDKQVYSADVFERLADAKAAGFTQAQVDSYIKAQMTRDGWVKT